MDLRSDTTPRGTLSQRILTALAVIFTPSMDRPLAQVTGADPGQQSVLDLCWYAKTWTRVPNVGFLCDLAFFLLKMGFFEGHELS